jgi:hypothetical protein
MSPGLPLPVEGAQGDGTGPKTGPLPGELGFCGPFPGGGDVPVVWVSSSADTLESSTFPPLPSEVPVGAMQAPVENGRAATARRHAQRHTLSDRFSTLDAFMT